MSEIHVEAEFAAPPERLWRLVRDFGNVSWLPGPPRCTTEGDGVGMVRSIWTDDGDPVRERLEAVDENERSIRYAVIQRNPLPVSGYVASMRVEAAGAGRSRLRWSSTFEPRGVSEEKAVQVVGGFYRVMIEAIRQQVEG